MRLYTILKPLLSALFVTLAGSVAAQQGQTAEINVDIKLLGADPALVDPTIMLLQYSHAGLEELRSFGPDEVRRGSRYSDDINVGLGPGRITFPIFAISQPQQEMQSAVLPLSVISEQVPITAGRITRSVSFTTVDKLNLRSHYGWREEADGTRLFAEINSRNVGQFLEFSELIMAVQPTDAEIEELFHSITGEVRTVYKFDNESAARLLELFRDAQQLIAPRIPAVNGPYIRTMVALMTGEASAVPLDVKIFEDGQSLTTTASAREFATTEILRVLEEAQQLEIADLSDMMTDIQTYQRESASGTDSCLRIALHVMPMVEAELGPASYESNEHRGDINQVVKSTLDCVQTHYRRQEDAMSMADREAGLCHFQRDDEYFKLFQRVRSFFQTVASQEEESPFGSHRTLELYYTALGPPDGRAFFDGCSDTLRAMADTRGIGGARGRG